MDYSSEPSLKRKQFEATNNFNWSTIYLFIFLPVWFHVYDSLNHRCMQGIDPMGNVTDSKVHGANMGLIWGRQDPVGPHEPHVIKGFRGSESVCYRRYSGLVCNLSLKGIAYSIVSYWCIVTLFNVLCCHCRQAVYFISLEYKSFKWLSNAHLYRYQLEDNELYHA